MSARQAVPSQFKALVDLSADILGTFVLYATDDYFAEKENLIKPGPPVWIDEKYTDKGKWMDGWESQRRRTEGHDFAILRLGAPGIIRGALVDTTHFRGNAPQRVALEGIQAPHTATAEDLLKREDWTTLLAESGVQPNFPNEFPLKGKQRVTHVRLRIYPDGGVARLRLYGDVVPEPQIFWRPGSLDLAAVEHGGTIAAVSDEFFGPPSNLLLPGRGVNMGDGWETKRRRTPGSDWAVVKLARRAQISRVELDTHFFKGNAPQATVLEALDAATMPAKTLGAALTSVRGWIPWVSRTPLVQHRRHVLEPERPMPVTHVRVHIFPHGGVNRLRMFGTPLDTPEEARALARLNGLRKQEAEALFLSFCGSKTWAHGMHEKQPFSSVQAMFQAAAEMWWSLSIQGWKEAFAAHPRIGEKHKAKNQTARSGQWSQKEQQGMSAADDITRERLTALNDRYFDKFGFIFIVFASGKSAAQMLQLLEERVDSTVAKEIENAAREQAKITRLRMERWLLEQL